MPGATKVESTDKREQLTARPREENTGRFVLPAETRRLITAQITQIDKAIERADEIRERLRRK